MKEDFIWTDELVREYALRVSNDMRNGKNYGYIGIVEFKQSKQPKKDWEIVAYASPFLGKDDVVFKKYDIFETTVDGRRYTFYEAELQQHKAKIHSVKRLSDGEVFAINDTVYYEDKNDGNESFIIGCIRSYNDDLHFYPLHPPYYLRGVPYCGIKEIKKHKKQPLFTTFDNVPIYEGDNYCAIDPDTSYGWDIIFCRCGTTKPRHHATFSTKEAAEEYIRLNKKTLSITDIINKIRRCCDGSYSNDPQDWDLPRKASEIINPLIELAKQKINNHE